MVLLSGAGLLAFAIVNLWGTVRDADARERATAERQAKEIARELGQLLQQPWIVEAVPESRRFEVKDGKVVVPAGVESTAQAAGWSEADLPLPAMILLQEARQEEFKNKDREAARKLLDRALSHQSLDARGRSYLTSVAAWQAYRAGDIESARKLVDGLGKADRLLPAAAASSLLLLVELATPEDSPDAAVLDALAGSCGALGDDAVGAIAQRLRDKELGAVERCMCEAMQKRHTLNLAHAFLPRLLAGETLFAVGVDETLGTSRVGDVCVFRAEKSKTRSGVGVIVPGREMLEFFGYVWRTHGPNHQWSGPPPKSPWQSGAAPAGVLELVVRLEGHIWLGENPSAAAAVVVPGFLAIRPHVAERSFWTQPATLIVLLIVISLCFGLGLVLSFRAMLKETAAVKARADFLTSVTHELKTPLASIRLLAEMLDEGRVKGEEKRNEYYRLLAGESARLTVLIENVLDLGTMERGERAYDLRRSHVDGIVREAVGVFEPLARRDKMELNLELGADDIEVQLDCGAFVQALLNVMENARKYASGGERLEIRSAAGNGRYELNVRDFGPGVPAREQEMIFQRFQRGQEQLNGNVAGVGLGLYLARTILRAHGGDLVCESADGGGSSFRFTLPVAGEETKVEEVDA